MTTQVLAATERTDARLLIGGEWVEGPAKLDVINPACPSEVVGTVVRGTPSDVDAAVLAAKDAQPAWNALGFIGRADALRRGLLALDAGVEERSILYTRENGKTLDEARGEIAPLRQRIGLMLERAPELAAARRFAAPNGRTMLGYRPYGVVVSIVPWNSPVHLAFNQIVAALLAGNGVVVKPPETAPLALISAIAAFASELPPGIINVVTGLPDEIGDALTTHPAVGKIGFTGSIRAAHHIGSNAAKGIKGVTLELGGNDPAILLDDVGLDEDTMNRMASSVFYMTGQVCMAIKRIYVPQRIVEQFTDAFSKAADRLVVGNGLASGVTMGPLHTKVALDRATALLDDARDRGADVQLLGKIHDERTFDAGYFMRPSVVTHIDSAAPLVVEEQFCATVPIIGYADLDEAFALANDSVYALGGSIWGRDVDRALDLADRIESGTIWVNAHGVGFINRATPYGGLKQSGIGLKGALEGILEYLQHQNITSYEPAA